jgi:hypothetical protein
VHVVWWCDVLLSSRCYALCSFESCKGFWLPTSVGRRISGRGRYPMCSRDFPSLLVFGGVCCFIINFFWQDLYPLYLFLS